MGSVEGRLAKNIGLGEWESSSCGSSYIFTPPCEGGGREEGRGKGGGKGKGRRGGEGEERSRKEGGEGEKEGGGEGEGSRGEERGRG